MAIVYRKSAKGVDEIQTRSHRLPPRLRSALILVDGQRSDDELARLVTPVDEVLGLLLEQGFIEPGARDNQPATPVPRATPTAPPPTSAPASIDLPKLRREAVRRLTELVGPTAEPLAIRMEKAADLEALKPLVLQARNLIAGMRGQRLADEYLAALEAL